MALELNDLMLIFAVCAVFICIVSVMVALVLRWIFDYNIMKRLESCENRVKGVTSGVVRDNKNARLAEVAVRAGELLKAGKKPVEIVQACIIEYPDVAFEIPGYLTKMAKKLGIEEAL